MKPFILVFLLLSLQSLYAKENLCLQQINSAVHTKAIQHTNSSLQSQEVIDSAYQIFSDEINQNTLEYCHKVNQWKNRNAQFPTQSNRQLELGYSDLAIQCANEIQKLAEVPIMRNGLPGGLAEDYAYQRAIEQTLLNQIKTAALKLCHALNY